MKLAPYRSALYHELQRVDLRLAALAHPDPDAAHHGDLADQHAARLQQTELVEDRARLQTRRALCIGALLRLEERLYGICVECAQPIPEARLRALPWSPRCVSCTATHERTPPPPLDMAPGDEGYAE